MKNREKIVRDLLVYGECAVDGDGKYVPLDQIFRKKKRMKKRHYLYLGLITGVILGMFLGIITARAEEHDASATMNIGARIIQCGTRYEALGQCKAGVTACCAFAPIEYTAPEVLNEITPSAGKHIPDIDMHGVSVTTEESDTGTIVNFE